MSVRLGIIGGMGPKATVVFFNNIVDHTIASSDADHVDMVILNNTKIPDRTAGILCGNTKPVIDELRSSVRQLALLEVDYITILCNTAYYFIKELQQETKIPIISIIEEAVKHIKERSQVECKGKDVVVGVLATDGTVRTGTYRKMLEQYGLRYIFPDKELQAKVMSVIYGQVKKTSKGDINDFNYLVGEMEKLGCDYIILGCTDLSWFSANYAISPRCVDALGVLKRVCIELSGKAYK
jgi:aspartate racemase